MSESHVALPAVLDRPVRRASVPTYLRDVFAHLPVPLSLEVDLPEAPSSIPLAARQFFKHCLLSGSGRTHWVFFRTGHP
jgi:hypothetical protein